MIARLDRLESFQEFVIPLVIVLNIFLFLQSMKLICMHIKDWGRKQPMKFQRIFWMSYKNQAFFGGGEMVTFLSHHLTLIFYGGSRRNHSYVHILMPDLHILWRAFMRKRLLSSCSEYFKQQGEQRTCPDFLINSIWQKQSIHHSVLFWDTCEY